MRILEKLDRILDQRGIPQSKLETMAGLYQGRYSKWHKRPNAEPSAWEALAMARALRINLEWLCDEEDMREESPQPFPSPDEAAILSVVRDLGLSREQAVLRLGRQHPEYQAPRVRTPEETARESAASELPPSRKDSLRPKRRPG